MDEYDKSGLDF